MTWSEDQDDLLHHAVEAREKAKIIVEHLENAGCSETLDDFRANVHGARNDLIALLGELKELLKRAQATKP